MDTSGVYDWLGSITIGTLVAWVLAIGAICTVIYKSGAKVYNVISAIKEIINSNSKQTEEINEIKNQFDNLSSRLDVIQRILQGQQEEKLAEQRHIIVRAGEDYITRGYITIRELKALTEVYEQYKKPGPDGIPHNGYVMTLMEKVNTLSVRGKLDEHGRDI